MRIVHIVVFKLVSLVVLAAGVLLVVMYFNSPLQGRVTEFTGIYWDQLAPVVGALFLLLGLLGLLPLSRKKRPSTISFPGEYGEVTIHLDSIEATLNRIVSKMPEVKKISVRLIPSEDNRRAEVTGSLWIYKGSEAVGVSEIVGKVQKHLRDTAINILGVEEIVMGKLDVPGIIVSASTAKAAPPEEKKAEAAPVSEAEKKADGPAEVPTEPAGERDEERAEKLSEPEPDTEIELDPVEEEPGEERDIVSEGPGPGTAFEPADEIREPEGEQAPSWRLGEEEQEKQA